VIPFNAIPDANVIPANDGLAIADPGSLRVTLRKGYCLIFNFRDFPGDPDKTRVGSGADVRRLEKTFKHLGADVLTFRNRTKENVRLEIRRLREKLDWASYDYLVVIIMSHGTEGCESSDCRGRDFVSRLASSIVISITYCHRHL
jgi:hypothetical protein